jgi:hypothetical protein
LNASDSHTNSSIKAMYGALIEFMTFSFQPWTSHAELC